MMIARPTTTSAAATTITKKAMTWPSSVPLIRGERDQRQVHRVEHQLDAHEHDDRVAPDQHADRADGEQQRGQHQVVGRRHRLASSLGPGQRRARRRGARCRRPRPGRARTAPTGGGLDQLGQRLRGHRAVRQQRRAWPPSWPWRTRRGRAAAAAGRRGSRSMHQFWRRAACGSRSTWASTIAPTAAVISSAEVSSNGEQVLGEQQPAISLTLPPAVRRRPARPPGVADSGPRAPRPASTGEADAEHGRGHPLAAQRLHHRVGGVAADQHQHEQEQDHDRAGVDDDLHDAQERRLLDEVEDAQAEHRHHQEQRRVDGVAGEHHAERPGQRDRAEDPEADGLAAPW